MKTLEKKNSLCLRLYKDILEGWTFGGSALLGNIYIKHLTHLDTAEFESRKIFFKQEASEKGLPSEKEQLEILYSSDHWTPENEKEYDKLTLEVKNLEQTELNIFLESQKVRIKEKLKEKSDSLEKISLAREGLLGYTSEKYAIKKINSYVLSQIFFRDKNLKEYLFSFEEYEELDTAEATGYYTLFNVKMGELSEKNLNRIAASGFFLNSVFMCKGNPYFLWGIPATRLTINQLTLTMAGNRYKGTLEMATDTEMPPYDDVDDVVAWLENQQAMRDSKNKTSSTTSSSKERDFEAIGIVGANKEEIKQLGASHGAREVDLVAEANALKKELGKDTLNTKDFVK